MPESFEVIDLGREAYAPAYERQIEHVDQVLTERETRGEARSHAGFLLLVEHHPPVITVSRRPGVADHLLASADALSSMGIEVRPTDRGGDITYHGPGQLVVYPILDLNLLGLRLHDYMRLLEEVVIRTCASFGIDATRDPSATGVWVRDESGAPNRKICAMGVRVKRWISMHGLALNVSTNLAHFDLIVPCGLTGRPVTSMERELGSRAPSMGDVTRTLVRELDAALSAQLSRGSSGRDPDRR